MTSTGGKAPRGAKAAAGVAGKAKALRRVGTDAVLAVSGDPRAIAKLAGRAALGVWRSPLARRLAACSALGAVLVLVVAAGGVFGQGSPTAADFAAGRRFGAAETVWAAYMGAGRVWCAPDGTVRLSDEEMAPPWERADWRLVAAVGAVESAHAAGRSVNAFGDVWPPVLGPVLDGTTDGLVAVSDSDGGRLDFDAVWDRAVGPMQLLPATVVHAGLDGNGDGIVDPHNVWDATASASAYLCVAGAAAAASDAVFAYNHRDEYVAKVLSAYVAIALEVPEHDAAILPEGAPLAYTPSSAPDVVLGSLVGRLGGDPGDVSCSAAGSCVWKTAEGRADPDAWQAVREIGYAAPVAVPGGFIASGDGTLRGRLPAPGGVSWPLPAVAPPQPAGARVPLWWAHSVPLSAPEWTAAGSHAVVVPAVSGTAVYAPSAGRPGTDSQCSTLSDADRWVWRLCGAVLDEDLDDVEAGHRLGAAAGDALSVELADPDGRPACPQRLFGLWAAGRAATPGALAAEIAAARAAARAAEDVATALEAATTRADALEAATTGADAEAAAARADALEAALYEACEP